MLRICALALALVLTAPATVALGDPQPPSTTIEYGPPPALSSGKVTFAFRSSEPGSTFACRIDDGDFQPCASPYTTDSLAQGDHVFKVRATGPLGDVDPTPAEWRFTIDKVIDGANAAARPLQRAHGRGIAITAEVRAGELATVRASGTLRVGKRRYGIRSSEATLVAGGERRLRLKPKRSRAGRRIYRALRHGEVGAAEFQVTFVDLLGNHATTGVVDVRLKARR